jgi:hypothetical protein
MILYYAPSWWMRIAVACTPFSWDDVMMLTKEKLGKKKKIRLPSSLVISVEQKRRSAEPRKVVFPEPEAYPEPEARPEEDSPGQMSMEDMFDR